MYQVGEAGKDTREQPPRAQQSAGDTAAGARLQRQRLRARSERRR